MGRPRKPIEAQTGHLTKDTIVNRGQDENAVLLDDDQLDDMPNWLVNDNAKEEYNRLVTELRKINIVGNLDKNNIANYCNAFALYVKATEKLRSQELILGDEKTEVENPLINIQRKYSEEIRKYAALCGLTIDSRLKAGSMKTKKQEENIIDKFGDI